MELVNGAKAEWKPEKENCTVYSFPGVAACGEPGCGSQREQMIKVICFFVVLAIYIAWLLIKMELVNGRKLFNLSVSYADSSLYQREPCYSLGLKCWFAIKQVYQREPCNSFGLKCWFTTEQVQEREPVLLKLWVYRFSINPPVGYADTLPCTGRANLRFIWLAISQRAVDLKFTFLTAEIMLIRSISIISQYFWAVSLYPKWGSRLFVITHIFFLSFP